MQIINKTTGTAIMQVKGLEFLHRLNDLPAGHNSASPSNLQFFRYALRTSGNKGITSEVTKLLRDLPHAASQRPITRYFNDARASCFKTGQPVLKWADRF